MVRFLLDENVPLRLKDTLVAKGFEVNLVVEILGAGTVNHKIVEQAMRSNDIILTFDEDFRRLRPEVNRLPKVVYFRLHPRDPREAERLLSKWIGKCVAMLEKGNVVILAKDGPVLDEW